MWVSVERSCSEDFDLRKRRKDRKKEGKMGEKGGEVNYELLLIGLKTHRLDLRLTLREQHQQGTLPS